MHGTGYAAMRLAYICVALRPSGDDDRLLYCRAGHCGRTGHCHSPRVHRIQHRPQPLPQRSELVDHPRRYLRKNRPHQQPVQAPSAKVVHTTLMTLLHSNFAAVATTTAWSDAVRAETLLDKSNLVESATVGRDAVGAGTV